MTRPTEAQLIEMEQRARDILDQIIWRTQEIERREEKDYKSPSEESLITAAWKALERDEQIARDVLLLVALIRSGWCCEAAA